MALSLEKIEALAPDQASLGAARKLLKANGWPTLAYDGAALVWGECQGSGATPYRVVISELDAGYKCTCPSRKFPCKHSLALMWMRAEGTVSFAQAPTPEWVKDWLVRRRGPSATAAAAPERPASASMDALPDEAADGTADAKAEARSAALRERNRQEREALILAGLDELDLWLSDQIDTGLAGFAAHAHASCRVMSQRLVDAKAPGLAARLVNVPPRLFAAPEAQRPTLAIQDLGVLHLLAEAYRRQETLSAALRLDVRQAVGWSLTREALAGDETAERASGAWRVVACQSEIQPDRLRRLETWLRREDDGEGEQRFAVLIDFVPVAGGPTSSGYAIGDRFTADLAFYPSPVPLRAMIVQQQSGAIAEPKPLALSAHRLEAAFAGYHAALAARPWLETFPLAFAGARVRRSGEALYLCDDGGTLALPLDGGQQALATPLLDLPAFSGIGLWDGRSLTLSWAETVLGRWVNA